MVRTMAIIKLKHGLASENPSMAFKLVAFRNLHIEANNLDDRKHGQEKSLNCLSEGRDGFPVMPTGYAVNVLYFNYLQLQ